MYGNQRGGGGGGRQSWTFLRDTALPTEGCNSAKSERNEHRGSCAVAQEPILVTASETGNPSSFREVLYILGDNFR